MQLVVKRRYFGLWGYPARGKAYFTGSSPYSYAKNTIRQATLRGMADKNRNGIAMALSLLKLLLSSLQQPAAGT